jgi:hypothetical protein
MLYYKILQETTFQNHLEVTKILRFFLRSFVNIDPHFDMSSNVFLAMNSTEIKPTVYTRV